MNFTALATIVGSLNFFPQLFSSNGTGASNEETSRVQPNTVSLEIYLESKCNQSTRFLHEQLVPAWMRLAPRINLTIVPFGKARCRSNAESYFCACEHGHDECQLNQLQNCVIDSLAHADRIVQAVVCIQDQENLEAALFCVRNNVYLAAELNKMAGCAMTMTGRHLLYKAGLQTVELSPPLARTPWIVVNGKHSPDAQLNLMKTLCLNMEPKPKECFAKK